MRRAGPDRSDEAAEVRLHAPPPATGDGEQESQCPSRAPTACAGREAQAGAAAPSKPAKRRPSPNPRPRRLTLQAEPFTAHTNRATTPPRTQPDRSFWHPQGADEHADQLIGAAEPTLLPLSTTPLPSLFPHPPCRHPPAHTP